MTDELDDSFAAVCLHVNGEYHVDWLSELELRERDPGDIAVRFETK